jgi:hypothetical protein
VKRVRIYLRKPAPRAAERPPARRPEAAPRPAAAPADKDPVDKEEPASFPGSADYDSPHVKSRQ